MYRLLIVCLVVAVSCSDKKSENTTETIISDSDTLMDTTTVKMKGDTTRLRLDNLGDSINRQINKATRDAGN